VAAGAMITLRLVIATRVFAVEAAAELAGGQ